MCRNIKNLFNFDPPVTEEEVRAASLQFGRKISGFNKPSKANEAAFEAAIDEVANVSNRLLRSLGTNAPPKNREEEAGKPKGTGGGEVRRLNTLASRPQRLKPHSFSGFCGTTEVVPSLKIWVLSQLFSANC